MIDFEKLKRIYPILSDDAKKNIEKVIALDLSEFCLDLGYTLVENVTPNQVQKFGTPKEKPKKKSRFLYTVHGRDFKSLRAISEAFDIPVWKLNYNRKNGIDFEDYIPKPKEQVSTIRKTVDDRGQVCVTL